MDGDGNIGYGNIGMTLFKERAGFVKFFCIALVMAGTAGLKFLAGTA